MFLCLECAKDKMSHLSAHNHRSKVVQDKNKEIKPFENKCWDRSKKKEYGASLVRFCGKKTLILLEMRPPSS